MMLPQVRILVHASHLRSVVVRIHPSSPHPAREYTCPSSAAFSASVKLWVVLELRIDALAHGWFPLVLFHTVIPSVNGARAE